MPTVGTLKILATLIAAIAAQRRDKGEGILGHMEAEACYLKETMPGTSRSMLELCADARRQIRAGAGERPAA